MKKTIRIVSIVLINCAVLFSMGSCSNNPTANGAKCADSTAASTTTTVTTTTTTASNTDSMVNGTSDAANMNATAEHSTANENNKTTKGKSRETITLPAEPTSNRTLAVTSTAFANNGVIPVKYTCDGQGATPPINIGNMPPGTKSYTLIVHDYNAHPDGGFTYWIIWNLDTAGIVPENFTNDHESMNAAKQYGYTPICSKSGNHKYHFIVYALDTKLVMGRNTTKTMMEQVMKGHILAKGELVGIYNKQLE